MTELVVGVDASRNRSGGAKAHLLGLLRDGNPLAHGIGKVHVWAYKDLLQGVPDAPWLVKHNPRELEQSLLRQVWWQYRHLPQEARRHRCDILFNTDAGTVCGFRPAVVMSQDMLPYEPGEMERFGLSAARLRLILLRFLQTRSMRNAAGVIFLTQHASTTIQRVTGKLARQTVIPLGVGNEFRRASGETPGATGHTRCLYVSNTLMYKHQWNVVAAIGELRKRGYDVSLQLAGGGAGRAQRYLDEEIAQTDPRREFVKDVGFVPHAQIPALIAAADLFIFASSCENMPVTLVEAMAAGIPIACSDRGPMPEILHDGGVYFDPENARSIAAAVKKIILEPQTRTSIARRAASLAEQYSWARCASETWEFLRATALAHAAGRTLMRHRATRST